MPTKYQIPLQGSVVDDAMAVDEKSARRLDVVEYESHGFEADNHRVERKLHELKIPVKWSATRLFAERASAVCLNFDLYVVAMSRNSGLSFGGIGYNGSRGAVVNGEFSIGAISHELGHNYGLFHANRWFTTAAR